MNEDELDYFKRRLSVESEKDLDNLSQLRNLDSSHNTVLSPRMNGHQDYSSSRSKSTQMHTFGGDSPKRIDQQTSLWAIDVQDGKDGEGNYSFSSETPVKKMRSKHEATSVPETHPLERQLTDSYLDAITRTPRYERHNTYDEMIDRLVEGDPFQGDYKPSGKSKKQKSKKHRHTDSGSDPIPLKGHSSELSQVSTGSTTKRHKKHKKNTSLSRESTRTFTIEGRSNPSYSQNELGISHGDEVDGTSVKSNGTYTLQRDDSQSELIKTKERSQAVRNSITTATAPVVRSPQRSQSVGNALKMSSRRRTKYGIDKATLAKFIRDKKIRQRVGLKVDPSHLPPKGKHIWHWKTDSKEVPCNSFGEIFFHGYGQDIENSPYVRVSIDTPPRKVWEIMTKHWHLKQPGLLISVTGGAKRFDMTPKLRQRVKRGLMNAATSTGAWIVTGGSNTGVMEFVGEAFRDHVITYGRRESVVVLGVSTWGYVKNREALEGKDAGEQGCFPAVYSKEDIVSIKGGGTLDENHTHFVFVDDGSVGEHGKEIKFRADLESFIGKDVGMMNESKTCVNIPVIQMIVEGGINSIKTVYESVANGLPVLVLEGSGRAADFISFAYHITENKLNPDESHFPKTFNQDMQELADNLFEWKKDDKQKPAKIVNCIKDVTASLKHRNLLNVINIKETRSDFDKSLLYALLKAESTNTNAQLSLALAWNRSDIAENEIFSYENKQNWQKMELKDAMVTALIQNKKDFVKLFLDHGLELSDFLDVKNLWNLYANCLTDPDSSCQMLNNLINYLKQSWGAFLCCRPIEDAGCQPDLLKFVGKAIAYLLGDESLNPYADINDLRFEVTGCEKELGYIEDEDIKLTRSSKKRWMMEYDFETPSKELFIWSILTNRKELAYLFWKMTPNPLGAALFASSLYKALSEFADNEEEVDISLSYAECSGFFQKVAVDVLTECYQKDRVLCNQLLVRRLNLYGKTTLMTLADSNELMEFMGHPCCQNKLNTVWKGRMALYTSSLKILLCIWLPFLIPSIKFTSNEALIDKIDLDTEEDFDDIVEGHGLKHRVAPEPEHSKSPVSRSKSKYLKKKLHKVALIQDCAKDTGDSISIPAAVYCFYTAPCTVFVCHTLAYLVFLGLFSYFVLTDLYPIGHPDAPSVYEFVTWGWTVTMVIEEFRQLLSKDHSTLRYKFKSWFDSVWNRFDLLMYMLFLLSVILRFSLDESNFQWARMTYSITLAMYFIRIMQTFYVAKNIGPKVIMIRKMLADLLFFFCILCVFILSFGVAYHANLFPNAAATWSLLRGVVYVPYFQMYGELFLENIEGEVPADCSNNETLWRAGLAQQCPNSNALVLLLAAVYMILTNILLVNLLIAMFSHTFQMVQDNSEKVWRFHMYALVYEYYDRPTIIPPLIILNHMFRVVRWILYKKFEIFSYHNDFKLRLDPKDDEKLNLFEKEAVEEYVHVSRRLDKERMEKRVSTTAERIEKVIEDLDNIKDHVMKGTPSESEKGETGGTLTQDSLLTARSVRGPSVQDQMDQLSKFVQTEMSSMASAIKRMEDLIMHQKTVEAHKLSLDITHLKDDEEI